MTLNEFQLLHQIEQVDLLYNEGVYIGKRRQGDQIVLLYQLEGFYIEVFYKRYRRVISRLLCFRSTEFILPYLEHINVEELINAH